MKLARLLGFNLLLLLCMFSTARAQNHVPNGSFDQMVSCPTAPSQADKSLGWAAYTLATPDYFHPCNTTSMGVPKNGTGYQVPAHGTAYAGVMTYNVFGVHREYLVAPVNALQPGIVYEVSLSASLSDICIFAANGLGVYFFNNGPLSVATTDYLPMTAQVSYTKYGVLKDTMGWVRLSGLFLADSAYDHLVIGAFPNGSPIVLEQVLNLGSKAAYYYIDSVVVKAAGHLYIDYYPDFLCPGDAVLIPYIITNNSFFNPGNVITAQLSDAVGDFSNPLNIGSVVSSVSGSVPAVIPAGIAPGKGYRMRVVSGSPAIISADNGKNIQIGIDKPAGSSNSPICAGDTLKLTANTQQPGISWQWDGPAYMALMQHPVLINTSVAATGSYIVTTTFNGCKNRDTIYVTVNPIPLITAGSNSPVCFEDTLKLQATSSVAGTSFSWSGLGFASVNAAPLITNANNTNTGTYEVNAMANGCEAVSRTVEVVVRDEVPLPTAGDTSICKFTEGFLSVSGDSLRWYINSNDTGNDVQPVIFLESDDLMILYVTQTKEGCESKKKPIAIRPRDKPSSELTEEVEICEGDKIMLGMAQDSVSYLWSTGSKACCIDVVARGNYIVAITNECGTTYDSVSVLTLPCDDCIWMPSAFSPNKDGKNDVFGGIARCDLSEYSMNIYNRWGELVFNSSDVNYRWDGRHKGVDAELGTYSYMVRYKAVLPGRAAEPVLLKGSVTMVR